MSVGQQAKIVSSGIALPDKVVLSSDIDKQLGCVKGNTYKATGVFSRHYATWESASELAAVAVDRALKNASIELGQIDCLIAASGTAEQAIPYNAAKIHQKLGFRQPVQAFDINMTCLSSLKAIEMGAMMISSGRFKRILIVSSEIASVGLNSNCPETMGLFGDGAAAVILGSDEETTIGFKSFNFETHSEGVSYCQIPGGGSLNHPSKIEGDYSEYGLFKMNGKELYRLTSQLIKPFVQKTLDKCDLSIEDIDWVVPHQASALAISHIQKS